jgi:hypothetical protein
MGYARVSTIENKASHLSNRASANTSCAIGSRSCSVGSKIGDVLRHTIPGAKKGIHLRQRSNRSYDLPVVISDPRSRILG